MVLVSEGTPCSYVHKPSKGVPSTRPLYVRPLLRWMGAQTRLLTKRERRHALVREEWPTCASPFVLPVVFFSFIVMYNLGSQ